MAKVDSGETQSNGAMQSSGTEWCLDPGCIVSNEAVIMEEGSIIKLLWMWSLLQEAQERELFIAVFKPAFGKEGCLFVPTNAIELDPGEWQSQLK